MTSPASSSFPCLVPSRFTSLHFSSPCPPSMGGVVPGSRSGCVLDPPPSLSFTATCLFAASQSPNLSSFHSVFRSTLRSSYSLRHLNQLAFSLFPTLPLLPFSNPVFQLNPGPFFTEPGLLFSLSISLVLPTLLASIWPTFNNICHHVHRHHEPRLLHHPQ